MLTLCSYVTPLLARGLRGKAKWCINIWRLTSYPMKTADLQFNIIFSPETAKHLSPFIASLLKWSDCRYQLIANGCSKEDRDLLENIAGDDPRLGFTVLSETETLEHGKALNWLFERNSSPWFCFMDSDIIATGPFLDKVAERLEHCDVVSSCAPIWAAPEDTYLPTSFRRVQGSHIVTDQGVCVASSYFVVFKSDQLANILQTTGVDFRIQRWENIAPELQQKIKDVHLDKFDYDTAKLIASLMIEQGAQFEYVWLDNLIHIGGYSANAGDGLPFVFRGGVDRLALRLGIGPLRQLFLYLADIWYGLRAPARGITVEQHRLLPFAEKRILESRHRKRLNTARYFNIFLRSLVEDIPAPPLPALGHAPAEQRIADVSEHIRELYRELDSNQHTFD
jgi:hypothetical protein